MIQLYEILSIYYRGHVNRGNILNAVRKRRHKISDSSIAWELRWHLSFPHAEPLLSCGIHLPGATHGDKVMITVI